MDDNEVVKYLVFPEIEAQNFNATAGAYISGVPQPTAICGLVHALLLRRMQKNPGALRHAYPNVMYGIHDYSGMSGQSRNPKYQNIHRAGVGDSPSAAMLDRPKASIKFSLVIKLVSDNSEELEKISVSDFIEEIERMRLNGASLWVTYNDKRHPKFLSDITEAIKYLPLKTFVLSDETEYILKLSEKVNNLNVVQTIADLCERPKDKNEYKTRYVPFIAGVHQLTDIKEFPGSINNHLHAYGESVIGLGRFRSISSIKKSIKDSLESVEETITVDVNEEIQLELTKKPSIFWQYSPTDEYGTDFRLVSAYTN